MKALELCIYPNSVLRKKALAIKKIVKSTKEIADGMLELMYKYHGIGLAATQVGVLQRLIVIDLQIDEVKQPLIMINPVIIAHSTTTQKEEEGCLSLPQLKEVITRFQNIKVVYTELDNQQQTLDASGLLSICIQHEIDHLNGVLFTDYLSKLKRQLILNKYKKLRREAE